LPAPTVHLGERRLRRREQPRRDAHEHERTDVKRRHGGRAAERLGEHDHSTEDRHEVRRRRHQGDHRECPARLRRAL
jgi:hypothetical protein